MEALLKEVDTASVTTANSTAAPNTPTSTAMPDDIWEGLTKINSHERDAVPSAGATFMIRDRIHGRVITLSEGNLQLAANPSGTGGWHWVCGEKNGWLGFRNCVSGTYIGHDSKGKFHAKMPHHKPHEYFCARRHPDGGYLLLMRHGDNLWKMDVADGNALIETEDEGTAWEFVKV